MTISTVGRGFDTRVIFNRQPREPYDGRISLIGFAEVTAHSSSNGGTDTLVNVERIVFAD